MEPTRTALQQLFNFNKSPPDYQKTEEIPLQTRNALTVVTAGIILYVLRGRIPAF
jgi:hypothetical protein